DGIRDFHVTGVQTCALPICGDAWTPPTIFSALRLLVCFVIDPASPVPKHLAAAQAATVYLDTRAGTFAPEVSRWKRRNRFFAAKIGRASCSETGQRDGGYVG